MCENLIEIHAKIMCVILSCRTNEQYECAERYVRLAYKRGYLNRAALETRLSDIAFMMEPVCFPRTS